MKGKTLTLSDGAQASIPLSIFWASYWPGKQTIRVMDQLECVGGGKQGQAQRPRVLACLPGIQVLETYTNSFIFLIYSDIKPSVSYLLSMQLLYILTLAYFSA